MRDDLEADPTIQDPNKEPVEYVLNSEGPMQRQFRLGETGLTEADIHEATRPRTVEEIQESYYDNLKTKPARTKQRPLDPSESTGPGTRKTRVPKQDN